MNKLRMFVCLIFQIIYNILNVCFAWIIMKITDSLVVGNSDIFTNYLGMAGIVVFCQIVFNFLSILLQNRVICVSMNEIRTKSLQGILNRKDRFLTEDEQARYIVYFTNELEQFENSYLRTRLNIVNSIMMLVFSGGMIFQLHKTLMIIVLFLIILMVLLPFIFAKSLQKANKEYLCTNKELIEKTEEILNGYEVIKSFFVGKRILNLYDRIVKKNGDRKRIFANKMGVSNVLTGCMGVLIILSTFIMGGYLILKSVLTVGVLLAVIQLVTNMMPPLMDVLYGINEMNSVKEIKDRVGTLCKEADEDEKEMTFETIGEKIEIKNLSYKYPEMNSAVIKDVNVVFEKGKTYAIVGGNGCGKSTFAKILSGYYLNYSGEIKIDGNNMKNIPENHIRSRIVYINQKEFLFDASPKENYTLFGQYKFNPILIDAIGGNELMKTFQSATTMSGGEQQKIIFLRGFSRASDVIICDESESAMDVLAKKKFMELLKQDKKRIKINITHTIDESLKQYDDILYFKDGVLVEKGGFDELYSMEGEFYKFVCKKAV